MLLLHFPYLPAVVCLHGLYSILQDFDGFFVVGYLPMQGGVFLSERVGEVFQIVGAPLVQTPLFLYPLLVIVRSRHVDAGCPYLVASDFACQPCFFQSSLNSRTVFHPVGLVDEPAI